MHVGDVADAIMAALTRPDAVGGLYELGGPRTMSMRDVMTYVMKETGHERPAIALPMCLARLQAAVLEKLPGQLLTRDQLSMLGRDNVVASGMPGLADLGIVPTPLELIVPFYLNRFRLGGHKRIGATGRAGRALMRFCAARRRCDKAGDANSLSPSFVAARSQGSPCPGGEAVAVRIAGRETVGASGSLPRAEPRRTVPTLEEDNGLVIPDSAVICEYLDEAYPDVGLMGHTLAERVEVRRLAAWFDGKFGHEVTLNLLGEKHMRRMAGRGNPDPGAMRTGYTALRYHLDYIGWLAETRKWLAGSALSLADFAAAAHLSSLDFIGDVDWSLNPAVKEWYSSG